ncbi:hypothetical protein LJR084_008144 [Variovorax sp. LjRoot84]|uniref:hypothetical protein n=1 Tax=Variovorax sp. LjRoot84 TaxID=3342340 RepID=UPI003ED16B95
MNAIPATLSWQDEGMLPLVDFKWLMAGVGWWIDVPRMRSDAVYAGQCIERALESGSQILRERCPEILPFLAHPVQCGASDSP